MNPTRFSRPVTILIVLTSPLLILAAFLHALFEVARDIVTVEIPDLIRTDIVPMARWSILEPLLAAYVAAQVRYAAYRFRVSSAFTGARFDVSWLFDELSFFVRSDRVKPSAYWTREAAKDAARSTGRFLKTLAGF